MARPENRDQRAPAMPEDMANGALWDNKLSYLYIQLLDVH